MTRLSHHLIILNDIWGYTLEKDHINAPSVKRGFTEYFHIANHIRVHTGGKPYTCTQCNKALNYKLGLKSEVISHSGEKPYQYYECGNPFRQCMKNKNNPENTPGRKKDELANELGLWNKDNDILKTFIIKVRNNVELLRYSIPYPFKNGHINVLIRAF